MAVKASAAVTLSTVRDISSVTWYYQLVSGTTAPDKPTASPPPSPWTTTEPAYTAGDTKYLYIVERTIYTDGTFEYTDPSLSSSYEAAKQAYNLANTTSGNLTTEINQRKAEYGTCGTAAATQAKAVTCSNFALYAGARIQVTFTYANTYISGAVQLNVNSTGAKTIYIGKTATSSTNLLLWAAGAKMEFVYDGTGWILQNAPTALYGTCPTAAATAAKAVTCAEAVICKGTTISVKMTYATSVASATLNVGSTVARSIYALNAVLTATSIYNWVANSTQKFIFDGQYWRMDDDSAKYNASEAKKYATGYLTDLSNGVYVHADGTPTDPTNSNAKGVRITDVIDIIRSGVSVAEFGGAIILGKHGTNDNFLEIASDGLRFGCFEQCDLAFLADYDNGVSIFRNGEGIIFEDSAEEQMVVFDYMNNQYTFDGKVFQNNHSGTYGNIGAVKSASLSSDKTAKTSTGTAACSISLEAGTWLVICEIRFASNGTGVRRANFTTSSGSSTIESQVPGSSNGVSQLNFSKTVSPTSTTTYYLNGWQNSGSNVTINSAGTTIKAIRLV